MPGREDGPHGRGTVFGKGGLTLGNSGPISDTEKLAELAAKVIPLTGRPWGDLSLGELLSCLEQELAARHREAYACESVTRIIEQIRRRVGE